MPFWHTVNLCWRWQQTVLLTWPLTLQSDTLKVMFPLNVWFVMLIKHRGLMSDKRQNVQKCVPAQQKSSQIMMKWQQQLTQCGYKLYCTYNFVISPLAFFIFLHKKHTYCSMRRNSVISSFLETSESRSGHTKEKPRTEQAHTKFTHHIGLLRKSLHRSNSWVDCRPRWVRQQVSSSCRQMQLGEDRQEPTML